MAGIGDTSPAAIEAIYAAASAPELWPQAIVAVADHIGLSGGLVAFHPPPPHQPFTVVGRLRDDLNRLYLRDYVVNPFALALQKVPHCVPQWTDTLVDMAAVRRSAFHADILAPQDIDAQLAFSHPSLSWPGGGGGFAFMLTSRQRDRRDDALAKLRPLVPHLRRAVDVSLDVGRRLAPGSHLEPVLAAMPGSAILLDNEGCVSFANAAAEALLAKADGLSVSPFARMHLVAADHAGQRNLQRAVRTSLLVARGQATAWDGTVRLTRPSGRPMLVVLTTPLPAPFHPFGPAMPERARVLVQVLGADCADEQCAEALRHIYALTPAEARVAALIGSGLPAPAVARALGVSLTTVRSHLGRCFDKTELRSQTELARLVARLPAMPPALGGAGRQAGGTAAPSLAERCEPKPGRAVRHDPHGAAGCTEEGRGAAIAPAIAIRTQAPASDTVADT